MGMLAAMRLAQGLPHSHGLTSHRKVRTSVTLSTLVRTFRRVGRCEGGLQSAQVAAGRSHSSWRQTDAEIAHKRRSGCVRTFRCVGGCEAALGAADRRRKMRTSATWSALVRTFGVSAAVSATPGKGRGSTHSPNIAAQLLVVHTTNECNQ